MKSTTSRWLAYSTVLFAAACGIEPTSEPGPDASVSTAPLTLAQDVQPILDKYCVRCHAYGAGDPHGEPHFTADESKLALERVSDCTHGGAPVALVSPGRPEASFLLFKLGAATDMNISGDPCEQTMPLRGDDPLAVTDPDAVARIRQWILDGAR